MATIIATLFGIIVGSLFTRYVLISPGLGEKTFLDYLKKFGLVGGTGVITMGLPIAGFFAYKKEAITESCLLTYFLAFLVTAIFVFVGICWFLRRSVPSISIPTEILKSYRYNLLVTLFLGGYPDVKNHLEALRILTRVFERTTADAEQLHKQLYAGDLQTKEQLAKDCKVEISGLDLIRRHLKCSEGELKYILETVRQHYATKSNP